MCFEKRHLSFLSAAFTKFLHMTFKCNFLIGTFEMKAILSHTLQVQP